MTGVGGRLKDGAYACAMLAITIGVVPLLGSEARASNQAFGPARLAVTIDDLPATGSAIPGVTRVEIAHAIIRTLKENGVDAYGFANGSFLKDNPQESSILKDWMAADFPLGNHTRDHLDLRFSDAGAYTDNIEAEAQLLRGLNASSRGTTAVQPIFRFPYLEEGETLEKRDAVRTYLTAKGYRIAEVTVDYNDWAWDSAYKRCRSQKDDRKTQWLEAHAIDSADHMLQSAQALSKFLYNRDIAHILLIHCNYFTAHTLDRLLKHWRARGVQFISLAEAMDDPVYSVNPNVAYTDGLHFLEQTARSRHLEVARLRDPLYPVNRIDRVCSDDAVD